MPIGMKLNAQGKPNKMNATYKQMIGVRKTYPKDQVRVLNIIGDIGNHNDSRVENISSESLKYSVADRTRSYRLVKNSQGKMLNTLSFMKILKLIKYSSNFCEINKAERLFSLL